MGNKYISPGVYVQERDITVVRPFSKRYLRRIKIGKIFGIDVTVLKIGGITSTPKGGPTNFPQIW